MNIKLYITERIMDGRIGTSIELLCDKGYQIIINQDGKQWVNTAEARIGFSEMFAAGHWIFTVDDTPVLHIAEEKLIEVVDNNYHTVHTHGTVPTFEELQAMDKVH